MIKSKKTVLLLISSSDPSDSLLTEFQNQWSGAFDFKTATTESEFVAISQDKPVAVIIKITELNEAIEYLNLIKETLPEALRFAVVENCKIATLEELYTTGLIHKYFDLVIKPDLLKIQIQEALVLIELVDEKNKFLELSITDPVTQLTNHRFFQQKLRQELHKAKVQKESLSLLMLDVDHFKLLNDQFGHPKGDLILHLIATEIKKQIPVHASASRYGGEEFAIILPKCTHKKAYELAEKIRLSITKIQNIDFRLSLSIGIACFPEHGLDADEILTLADHALYCAKRQGRNMIIVAGDITY